MGKPSRRDELPLNPQTSLQVLEKWAIEFIGMIQPPEKKIGVQYIITMMEYLMRWVESEPMKDCIVAIATKFWFEYVLNCTTIHDFLKKI